MPVLSIIDTKNLLLYYKIIIVSASSFIVGSSRCLVWRALGASLGGL